ncbi:MAG: phage replisome organizer N-terminal domain-containing protein, partial [Clostridia bacterium]|nr:phage replisome organizer N-terminal domain-containing protein [Clostridia bacterium]
MKWFKSPSDKYDEPRMKMLRSLENGNIYALIYDMLNALAARCNMNGVVAIDETTPYCAEELGIVLGFDEATMFDALESLEECRFIERKDGFITIRDWEEEQFDEWKEDKVMKSILNKKNEKKEKKQKKEKKEKENIKQEQKQAQKQEQKQEQIQEQKPDQEQEQSNAVAFER